MSHEQARPLDRTTSLRGELRLTGHESAGRTAATAAAMARPGTPTDGHPAAPLIARQFARCVVPHLTRDDLWRMAQIGCVLPPAVEGPEAATLRAKAAWITRRANGSAGSDPLVRPDGSLRPDAYTVDEETGCWTWQHSVEPRSLVPKAGQTINGQFRLINVRRHVYGQRYGTAPKIVSPGCGNRRCINPEHQTDQRINEPRPETVARIRDLCRTHPMVDVAAMCGCNPATVAKYAGKGRPRRSWSTVARYWRARGLPGRPATLRPRDWVIFSQHVDGVGSPELAAQWAMSRQRISQIVHRVDDLLRALEERP